MFTLLQTVVLLVLSFLFGSVINMMMLAKKYENRVVKEEIEATQNRGDNMNGLSRIKNMSTKRFYRSIFGIVLLALITVGYVLYTQEVIANDYSAYVYVVIGLFAAYVLLVEKTITVIHIPIFRMWKDGKPARKEKRAERKAQKEAEKKEIEDLKLEAANQLAKELEEKERKKNLDKQYAELKRDAKPEPKKAVIVVEGTVVDKKDEK